MDSKQAAAVTSTVESDSTMTRRRLKEAGFGDEQVQALVDVTGAERRALSADMAGLKASEERVKSEIALLRADSGAFRTEMRGEIAGVHTRIDGVRDEVNARFDGVREEMNARFDGVREEMNAKFERVDARFDGVREEMNARFVGARDEMNAKFERVDAKFDGLDSRLKLVVWFVGVGVTVYVGTTVSLVMILFRNAPV